MSVGRNTAYNIAGAAAPLVVSLVTIPLYLEQIGYARYGVLAIVWLLLGYFGLFDLGLSRATANQLARLREASVVDRERIFWTAMILNTILGIIGGIALLYVGGPILRHAFNITENLRNEALGALPYIAAAVPLVTLTAVMSGALEAKEKFGILNTLQGIGGVVLLCAPLAAAYFIDTKLQTLIAAAVVARALSLIPIAAAVINTLPLTHRPTFHAAMVRPLFTYGVWITITNIVGPILMSIDRFIIGAVSGAAAVAYYDIPYRVVTRSRIFPSALARALFPHFSAATEHKVTQTSVQSIRILSAIMTPLVVLGILFVRPLLSLWLGDRFAMHAAPVAELLLVGVWINSLAAIPFTALQGQGRPDLVAKAHLFELIPYILFLWWATHSLGLLGVALAWTLRVMVDTYLQLWFSNLHRTILNNQGREFLIVTCAWIAAHSFTDFSPLKSAIGISLFTFACILSMRGAPELRTMLSNTTRRLR